MQYKIEEIKQGIKLHSINTPKFKTNIVAMFITTPLTRENVTKNAVISSVLRRGSLTMPTQEQISKDLENMYGAAFDCGIDKIGDNQVLKFYLESINDNYLPQDEENILKRSCNKLFDIVCNPFLENGAFKEEYVQQEKETIRQLIEGDRDNKAKYAYNRCIEEMYKDKPYGLFKYGYIEDLENINSQNLYQYYKQLLNEAKIDIFISGNISDGIENVINDNNIQKLIDREPKYNKTKLEHKDEAKEKCITESMEVTQGKLVLGLDVDVQNEKEKYDALLYNSILGGTANSKLFQNVREKASLAYTASSSYLKHKSNILINCGIEIKNYEKALKIIKEQLEDMEKGNFSEEDIQNSKKIIISTIKSIDDEQDTEITYFLGQELADTKVSLEEYIKLVNDVQKENIVDIANKVKINTIYFLKD